MSGIEACADKLILLFSFIEYQPDSFYMLNQILIVNLVVNGKVNMIR